MTYVFIKSNPAKVENRDGAERYKNETHYNKNGTGHQKMIIQFNILYQNELVDFVICMFRRKYNYYDIHLIVLSRK